jgi:hypothetical protein
MGVTPEEVSPYEAKVFMDLHETFVEKAVGMIARLKDEAESSESSASDLDEVMSSGIEDDSDSYDGDATEDELD